MPHDKNGALIEVGDLVTIEFTVKQVTASEEFCNVNLESVERMPGNDSTITLAAVNTRQCVKVQR